MPKDRAIVCKMFAMAKEVDGIVKYLTTYERAPMCIFLNPETMNNDRKEKQQKFRDKR